MLASICSKSVTKQKRPAQRRTVLDSVCGLVCCLVLSIFDSFDAPCGYVSVMRFDAVPCFRTKAFVCAFRSASSSIIIGGGYRTRAWFLSQHTATSTPSSHCRTLISHETPFTHWLTSQNFLSFFHAERKKQEAHEDCAGRMCTPSTGVSDRYDDCHRTV